MTDRIPLSQRPIGRRSMLAGAAASAAALFAGTQIARAGRSQANPVGAWSGFRAPVRSFPKTFIEQNVPIPMDDGVIIRVDVWYPADESGAKAPGQFPVIVTSHCYGKSLLSAMADYSRYGYVVVVADVRGTGASDGSFGILDEREARDGYNIVEWAGTQPFSTGKVGVDGFSYLGSSSAKTAATRPPHLVAANFGGAPTDLYRTFLTQGGNWTSSSALWFVLELLGVAPLPFALNSNDGTIDITPRNPVADIATLIARFQADGDGLPFRFQQLGRILDENQQWDDSFWIERGTDVSQIEVPTLVYSGWADLFLRDTPRDFRSLQLGRGEKLMVIGPWTHYSLPKNIGVGNDQPLDDLLIAWFDHWLKGVDNGVDQLDPVLLWENGSERWVGNDDWPIADSSYQRLYLTGDKSGTSQSVNDGSLAIAVSAAAGQDTEVIDPTNGVCSRQTVQYLGGLPVYLPISFFISSFPVKEFPNIDQIAPCFRKDDRANEIGVLTYTTSTMSEDVSFTGSVAVTLQGSTTAADPCWVAWLSDVAPDGTARPIGEGALVASRRKLDPARTRYAPNGDVVEPFQWHTQDNVLPVQREAVETYNIEIWPTSWRLLQGHRLRLTIDGAELPHLLPTSAAPKRLGDLTLHHGAQQSSFLSIPVHNGALG
ncbi:CocE/NonD family hydrolase [Nocardia sp. NPDC052112]|uniref:CocE/NonD family hydrolase n=1 Tax=Nocardia sp. NPDC052112 TaxID=3155646 RepID=UPI003449BBC4